MAQIKKVVDILSLGTKSSQLLSHLKLDGVGAVDNRPSTNKLHKKEEEEKRREKNGLLTHNTRHVTCGA